MARINGVKYHPEILETGETLKQLLARTRHALMQSQEKWNELQRTRIKILFERFSDIEQGYQMVNQLRRIYNQKQGIDTA